MLWGHPLYPRFESSPLAVANPNRARKNVLRGKEEELLGCRLNLSNLLR